MSAQICTLDSKAWEDGALLRGFRGDDTGVIRVPAYAIDADILGESRSNTWWSTRPVTNLEMPVFHPDCARPFCTPPIPGSPTYAYAVTAGCPMGAAFEHMSPASMGTCFMYSVGTWGEAGQRTRVLALAMEGTLIRSDPRTAEQPRGSVTGSDWVFTFPCVPDVLRQAHARGYKCVILATVQDGARRGGGGQAQCARARAVALACGIPAQIFVAPASDFYCPPCPGMWWLLSSRCNGGVPIDQTKSLYVGGRAGRPGRDCVQGQDSDPPHPRDGTMCDLGFAVNCGLPFTTPEHFFGGSIDPWDVNPAAQFVAALGSSSAFLPEARCIPPPPIRAWIPALQLPMPTLTGNAPAHRHRAQAQGPARELVLLVGPPGSGKSTYSCSFPACEGYVLLSRDVQHDSATYTRTVERVLGTDHKSVVLDATNVEAATRRVWAALARQHGASRVRAYVFDATLRMCLHLNALRGVTPLGGPLAGGLQDHRTVPATVLRGIFSRVETVQVEAEGIDEVTHVPFVPGPYCDGMVDAVRCDACTFARGMLYSLVCG